MLKTFLHKLQQTLPDFTDKSYLLAVSGGVDSMAMVELFSQAGLQFAVAHCNFQLRKEDSFLDEELVKNTTQSTEITFHLNRFDTEKTALKNKESIQITARNLRYEWFRELQKKHAYDFIVTGHHANDNLETAIYKLAKGTGIKGVRGILPLHNNLLRPLVHFTKKELLSFAQENKVIWREDISNESEKYKRNFIRKQIIPLLEELNPQAVSNFKQTAERLRLAEQVLNDKVTFLKKKLFIKDDCNDFIINKSSFKSHQITPSLLFELLDEYQFSYSTCVSICENNKQLSGTIYTSKSGFQLINDRENLHLSLPKPTKTQEQIPIKGGTFNIGDKKIKLSILPFDDHFKFEQNPAISYFNYEDFAEDLEVRNWQLGDKIAPFGMHGKQKISDILINQKVPVHLKKEELVLTYKKQIIWLIGRRASRLFQVNKGGTILKIELIK